MHVKALIALAGVSLLATAAAAAPAKVLWWDSTPVYGGQAPDSARQKMSDYLSAFDGGSVFASTYVSSEVGGTLAAHLASNSYDVIIFDATSSSTKFNAADLEAVRSFYAAGKKNLLLDGNLYVRSISFNETSNFPGINGSTGKFTANEVYALAKRGGGIMVGTDHEGFQVDANQIVGSLLTGAGFSGITTPSTDGVYTGTELLTGLANVAPADLFAHYSSIPSQGVAPTGTFTDFLGNQVTLYSQLNVANYPGGGQRFSYISTSFSPSGGDVDIDDPDPPIPGGVPEPATWAMMILGFGFVGLSMRRRRGVERRAS